ncbi:hypothetical protein ECIAI39_0174 [Escherichia coli IAI39]|uniref:Uncharacterized protein n=1 Tax=Escherichia coli O7:K1 (strain IAI39 / ExPEC) TaxID=585057 RepID=A0A0H3ME61_ECO7I|nr:hypothetical protein ECIAI39_0174 [Escherichia coli IAI39]
MPSSRLGEARPVRILLIWVLNASTHLSMRTSASFLISLITLRILENLSQSDQTVTHSGSVLSIALIKHITGKIPRDTYAESYPYLSITGIIP